MLIPPKALKDWKVTTIGEDIAWIKPGKDGRLYAINPEAGAFGVAPGTSAETNPNCLAALKENTIFTNVAMTPDGDVWWEGLTKEPPPDLIDWQGNRWTPGAGKPGGASRTRASPSPPNRSRRSIRTGTIPPACRSAHSSSAAAARRRCRWLPKPRLDARRLHGRDDGLRDDRGDHRQGRRRARDPFAMLPFCGYHFGDYFKHWLKLGRKLAHPPKIFA